MTPNEFSSNFSTLLNSFASSYVFGTEASTSIELDEREKSFFLSKAQENMVIELYTGKSTFNESFEQTEELRRYLAPLVVETELQPIAGSNNRLLGMDKDSKNTKFFTLPDGTGDKPAVWFITYESAILAAGEGCDGLRVVSVYPVRQDEYERIKKNPFRGVNKRRALRLDLSDGIVEIRSSYNIASYYIRYLKKPRPIIVGQLDGDSPIDGLTEETPCELPESLHQKILERAVLMALQSKGIRKKENN